MHTLHASYVPLTSVLMLSSRQTRVLFAAGEGVTRAVSEKRRDVAGKGDNQQLATKLQLTAR
jgi:hypothetical protein